MKDVFNFNARQYAIGLLISDFDHMSDSSVPQFLHLIELEAFVASRGTKFYRGLMSLLSLPIPDTLYDCDEYDSKIAELRNLFSLLNSRMTWEVIKADQAVYERCLFGNIESRKQFKLELAVQMEEEGKDISALTDNFLQIRYSQYKKFRKKLPKLLADPARITVAPSVVARLMYNILADTEQEK